MIPSGITNSFHVFLYTKPLSYYSAIEKYMILTLMIISLVWSVIGYSGQHL